jgi:matrixin
MIVFLLVTVALSTARRPKRIAPNAFYLGRDSHPRYPKKTVDSYLFLHYYGDSPMGRALQELPPSSAEADHFQRQRRRKRSAGTVEVAPYCASLVANGVLWKTSRGYFIAGKNRQSFSEKFLIETFARAANAWRCALRLHNESRAASLALGPLVGIDMRRSQRDFDMNRADGLNVIAFGSVEEQPGATAGTRTRGRFTGPIEERELAEYDIIFNDAFEWGNSSEVIGVHDLESIATHEFGHALGLSDIYDPECQHVTMFGTSLPDEINKRTLESEDIEEVTHLYADVGETTYYVRKKR